MVSFTLSGTGIPDSSRNAAVPMMIFSEPLSFGSVFIFAEMPFPGTAEKSETGTGSAPASSAFRMIAFESGCSDPVSAPAAAARMSFSENEPSKIRISVTTGRPRVSVPVLSKMTASTFPAVSRLSPLLIRIPSPAPMPVPTMTAAGVARPTAQGHEIIRTAVAARSEKTKADVPS